MKATKRRKPILESQKILDTSSEKRRRGRPETIPRSWVIGRAENDRYKLSQVWARLARSLLAAESEDQVRAAFEEHGQPHAADFAPRATLYIFELIREPSFPKRPKAQIGFSRILSRAGPRLLLVRLANLFKGTRKRACQVATQNHSPRVLRRM
jgi:hypothetical protein